MLKEFIELIGKNAVDAVGPQIEEYDPTKKYVRLKPDGGIEIIGGDPIWRRHKALDLDTIVRFALRFAIEAPSPSIWYNRFSVICLIDDTDRRERVQFDLEFSEQILKLKELESQPLIDQRALVFMLRTVFKNCLGRVPNLIELLRSVEWGSGFDGETEIQRGKSSIGATARAQLKSKKGEIPEYVAFTVPVFANGSLAFATQDIEVVVEPIEESKSFKLFPVPGALELTISKAESDLQKTIAEGLGETEVPIYYGTP